MKFAGAIGLLCEAHLHLPRHEQELKENIVTAVHDWCELTGWKLRKTLDRLEVIPPEPLRSPVEIRDGDAIVHTNYEGSETRGIARRVEPAQGDNRGTVWMESDKHTIPLWLDECRKIEE